MTLPAPQGSARLGPLILGASGQIGQMLYRLWDQGLLDFGGTPVWQHRIASPQKQTLIWDTLSDPAPDIACSGVICLAGGPSVARNVDLAQAAVTVARGAPVLFASTQAVYGPQVGVMTEDSPCLPQGTYGETKLAAEHAIAAHPNVTSLRIGNAIGADALLRSVQRGPVRLDQFPDGQGPRRMMIGPQSLGQAFIDMLALGDIAAPVLNLAQPGLVAMADLLEAARADWAWQAAPATALPSLEMDLTHVQRLIDLAPADPADLMAQVRAAGWRA